MMTAKARFRIPLLLALGLALAAMPAPARAQTCKSLGAELDKIIEGNRFYTVRGLPDYFNDLGKDFIDELSRLGPDGHWVDMGAGEGLALQDYLSGGRPYQTGLTPSPEIAAAYDRIRSVGMDQKARVTGVTFAAKTSSLGSPKIMDRFRLMKGRLLEDIPSDEIGQADVVTDFFGVLAYTKRPDVALSKYLELIDERGSIHVFLGLGEGGEFKRTLVTLPSGEQVGFVEWIKGIPGIRVETATHGRSSTLTIRKVAGADTNVPELELVEIGEAVVSPVPTRVFRVKPEPMGRPKRHGTQWEGTAGNGSWATEKEVAADVGDLEASQVAPAVIIVTSKYRRDQTPPPIINPRRMGTDWSDAIDKRVRSFSVEWSWRESVLLKPSKERSMRNLGHGNSEVYEIKSFGKSEVFRPMTDNPDTARVVRRTFAASLLNKHMGLDTVPEARLAKIGDEFGVISAYAPDSRLRKLFVGKKAKPESQADAQGFEFLIGNFDIAQDENYSVLLNGQMKVYDHDKAFGPGIPDHLPGYEVGSALPERYTARFIEALRLLDEANLKKVAGKHLSKDEIAGVLFRRDVMLEDFARRKPEPL